MNDPDNVISNFERHRQARAKLGEGNKGAVFDALAAANITEVHVEFDGEGDSGQIESVTAFRGKAKTELPATKIRVQNVAWGNAEIVTLESALKDAIETLCYDYLEDAHGGWENNDGGYGEFRLDVPNRTVSLEINERYTDTRDATDDEKPVLARYVGWGAMASVFGYDQPQEWRSTAGTVKELLTAPEFESARASTPNAHFTSPQVIETIWGGLHHLGLGRGAQILEPAMGVGHFFGLMPESVQGGHRTGVELDSITARIAKKLYPDSTIFAKGFEETPLPDNYFDAIVGNVPFGDYAVHDPSMKPHLTRAIHDYFFAKSLEKLRPGGVMALITSCYTMDKQADTIRRHLAEHADLLGAIRLPNTAFKGNAGTEVTTDILFLRKRAPGAQPEGHAWRGLETIDSPDGPIAVNEYYASHPEMMLGKMKLEGTMYRGSEPTLEGQLTPELLRSAIESLPDGAYIPRDEARGPPPALLDGDAFTGIKDGAYAQRDGAIVIRNGNSFEAASLSVSVEARIKGMMAVRDAVRLVFRTQLEDAPEERIVEARKLLNNIYDSFVARYAPCRTPSRAA